MNRIYKEYKIISVTKINSWLTYLDHSVGQRSFCQLMRARFLIDCSLFCCVVGIGQLQRSEENSDKLMAEIQLLKQDLHTSKKEFILACKLHSVVFINRNLK